MFSTSACSSLCAQAHFLQQHQVLHRRDRVLCQRHRAWHPEGQPAQSCLPCGPHWSPAVGWGLLQAARPPHAAGTLFACAVRMLHGVLALGCHSLSKGCLPAWAAKSFDASGAVERQAGTLSQHRPSASGATLHQASAPSLHTLPAAGAALHLRLLGIKEVHPPSIDHLHLGQPCSKRVRPPCTRCQHPQNPCTVCVGPHLAASVASLSRQVWPGTEPCTAGGVVQQGWA